MISGYVKGRNLDSNTKEKIELLNDSDNFLDISVVSAPSGAWARQNKIIDRDTDDAVQLKSGTYVLSGLPETSNDNAYTWKQIIYFQDDKLKVGYMASEYLLNVNLENNENTFMKIAEDIPTGCLNLRTKANRESKVITAMPKGSKVVVIPNVSGASDDRRNWLYVAYKSEESNDLMLGWAASSIEKNDGTEYNYLEEIEVDYNKENDEQVKEENIGKKEDSLILKIVSTNTGVYLNLREESGDKSKILARIQNGTTVFTTQKDIDKCEKSAKVDGKKWIHITLEDGSDGWVASEFLRDKSEQKVFEKVRKQTVDLFREGKIEGYMGVDLTSDNFSVGDLERLILGKYQIPQGTGIGKCGSVPNFIYIKTAATGWGKNFRIASNNSRVKKVKSLMRLCEKYQIPYGLYYYSQAITEQESQQEINCIKKFYANMGDLKYNVLPFAVDIELGGNKSNKGRMLKYVNQNENGKQKITKVKNNMMNKLRKELGKDVIMYTDKNTLCSVINYDEFDQINQKDVWMVDVNNAHSKYLIKNKQLLNNVKNRQVAIDKLASKKRIDMNFMDSKTFEKYISGLNKEVEIYKSKDYQR